MVNRYYKGDPYRGQLYTPPVQFIAAALEGAQKKYDVNYAGAQELKNKFIQARSVDRARANQIEQELNGKVDALAAKYNGDYSQATKDLYSLQSEMAKLYGPGGEAGAIQANLLAEQESLKTERARLAKGEITADQFSLLQNYYQTSPATTLDKNTGVYSQLNPLALNKYADPNKIFEDTYSKLKPRTIERSGPTGRDYRGNIEFQTTKQTGIDPNELAAAFRSTLTNNDEFMGYINQTAQLGGQDPNGVLNNILQDYEQNVIPLRSGILEDSNKLDYKADWQAQEAMSYRHRQALQAQAHRDRKDEIKFKDELANAAEAGSGRSAYLTIGASANSSFKPISLTKRVGANAAAYNPDPMHRILFGDTKEVPLTVTEAMKDKNVNAPMLESIRKANPSLSDGDVLRLYNDRVGTPTYSELQYTPYETTSAQQEAANRLLPELISGRVQIWKIDEKTKKAYPIEDQDRVAELTKAWQDPKNPMKARTGSLGKTKVASGHVPYGELMPDPEGAGNIYVIKENRTDIRNLQDESLDPAFKFIQDDSRLYSDPIKYVNAKGEPAYMMGRKEYVNGFMQVIYYDAPMGPKGPTMNDRDPVTVNGRYAQPADIERMLLPNSVIQQTFPRKTKAAYENETLLD